MFKTFTLKQIANLMVSIIGWIKKKQVINLKESTVKLNVGSCLAVAKGWINIDCSLNAFFSKYPVFILKQLYKMSGFKENFSQEDYCRILIENNFIYHNLEYGLPFLSNSANYIYSSHLLEHLFLEDAQELLKEMYRVLKDDGIVRICVPDLDYAIQLFQKDKQEALNYFFTSSNVGYHSRHKYMYDFKLLKQVLEKAGFNDIKKYCYKEGNVPDIGILDNRPEETIFVEANKRL
mgnify:CR=1 FL=1